MGFLNDIFSSNWTCPVCGRETNNKNKGSISFEGLSLCNACSPKIEEVYKNKHLDRAFLEEMRAIVTGEYEDTDNNYETYKNILYDLYTKYQKLELKHFSILEEINEQYSIAIHQDKINQEVQKCINLCIKDISIADELFEYYNECKKILKNETRIPSYPAFSKLSRLFELFYKDYLMAIYYCYRGLMSGYRDDSKNGFKGKIAKYLNKYNKMNGTNYQFDYDKAILFDNNTGEVLDIVEMIANDK